MFMKWFENHNEWSSLLHKLTILDEMIPGVIERVSARWDDRQHIGYINCPTYIYELVA